MMTQEIVFTSIGFLGQAFFFGRFLLQWLASERAKRIVVPAAFWWMSLAGGIAALIYAVYMESLIFAVGAAVPLFIYPRNIILLKRRQPMNRGLLIPLGLGVLAISTISAGFELHGRLAGQPTAWLLIGGIGQLCWVSRFPLQWWISERLGRPVLPAAFFWVSLVGSVLVLSYAIYVRNPVFILGQVLTPLLATRNLMLCYRRKDVPRQIAPETRVQPASAAAFMPRGQT